MANYFDKDGNYINVENLSLADIYHKAFALGVESVAIRPQGDWKSYCEGQEVGFKKAEDVFERMELIQETVDCIRNTFNLDTESDKLVRNCMALVQNAIDGEYHDMEEVDVSEIERPQGKWIETGYETGALGITYRQTQCSNCGWEQAMPMWLNYCSNCGAKMKKGGAE